MKSLLHSAALLSIGCIVTVSTALGAAPAKQSPYYGRWTVYEDQPVFTAKGRPYKTIDIAVCGNDFCGVSVGEGGKCGPTLFRFLARNAGGDTTLRGKGRWGSERKNVQIDTWETGPDEGVPGGRLINLYLGDGHSFGERSASMPRFHAEYRRTGEARCKVG